MHSLLSYQHVLPAIVQNHTAADALSLPAATLSVAARILAVEAYHAGIVRDQLYELDYAGMVLPYGLPVAAVVQAISNLRDSVDGPTNLDMGILAKDGTSLSTSTLVPTDANALTFTRDISQVLAIVYLGAADMPGGFFPEGVNGRFGPVRPCYPLCNLALPCLNVSGCAPT